MAIMLWIQCLSAVYFNVVYVDEILGVLSFASKHNDPVL